MKNFYSLCLFTLLLVISVSAQANDPSLGSITIPQDVIEMRNDNTTALKDTFSEIKPYLEKGLSKWILIIFTDQEL